jgi:hypothetical protein
MMITAGRRPTSTPGTQTGYVSNSSKSQISLLPETDLREGHPPLGWRKCAGGAEAPFEFRGGAHYGIEHEAMEDAHDVVTFEDFGDGQTKLTLIGNETMESAKNSGQVEGWIQILDKVAAVVAELERAK